jgi:hypothetical protein
VLALALSLSACRPDGPGGSATSEESDSSTSASTEGEPTPDLPPEPDCPATLGELVTCECAFVDGCMIDSVDGQDCTVECEQPSACEQVTCNFDWAHGDPVCVELVNPEALACALEAVSSGQPTRVELALYNTYPFVSWTERRSLLRLDATRWLKSRDRDVSYDVGAPEYDWDAWVLTATEADLQACAEADFAEAQFQCLFDLGHATEDCTDMQALTCMP